MRKLRTSELGRLTVDQYRNAEKSSIIIILDNIRSQYNTGSVFRTADAFAVRKIYLCGITGQPPAREIMKTALGATESVEWSYFKDTCDAIREVRMEGYIIAAVEQVEGSIELGKFLPGKEGKYALVFGHEINGVDQRVIDCCDLCIEIPQFGTKHSFNIAVSAGIVLWELTKKISG
ncbi:MAG: RNA methyltransferase [Bacteroidales bacterium]|jgi:23S rRNA (guanosine2251-2'-O)-methyltransferase